MKKIITTICLILTLISCVNIGEKKGNLELEILNDTLVAFPYYAKKDTINVLEYSIINNSDFIYYFKQGSGDDFLSKKIYKNGIYVKIFDTTNKEVTYSDKLFFEHQNKSDFDSICNYKRSIKLVKETERLKEDFKMSYYSTKDIRHYFFIHPNERLFFKQYINLTDSLRYEDTRMYYAHLKKNIKYSSKFYIPSDSTDFKKQLPNNILKTIETNNVKVYNGVIESKNKVSIKVLEP